MPPKVNTIPKTIPSNKLTILPQPFMTTSFAP